MGLGNMIGLGFSFGFKDRGFEKGVSGAKQGLVDLKAAFTGVKDVAGAAGAALLKAARLPSFSPAINAVQSIAGDMKMTTTNLEAFGVMADKSTRKAFAGFNMTASESKRARKEVAGLAYGLNMDVGTLADSWKALKQNQVDVTKIGFKSFKEFSKFREVTGLDAKQFSAAIGAMRSQFKMTDAQIKQTVETAAAIGKRFDMGSEAMGGMVETMKMLSEEGATMFATMGPERTQQFLKGTQLLSAAYMKAGRTAEEAQQAALGVGRALLKGEVGMSELYSGLQSEFPETMTVLTQHLGRADEAFATLQQDPMAFAGKWWEAIAEIKAADKAHGVSAVDTQKKIDRFALQMTKQFGPGFTALITGSMDDVAGKLAEVRGATLDTDKAVGQMSSQYRSGLTYADLFARAQDQFRTSLKHVSSQIESDGKWLKRYKESTKLMLGELGKVANDKGPVGMATRTLIEFSNHGIGGVLSKISPLGPAIGSLMQQFGPIIMQMPGLVAAFSALASPITLVVGAIAMFSMYQKEVAEGGGRFTSLIDGIGKKIPELANKFLSFAKQLAPKFLSALGSLGEMLIGLLKKIPWQTVGQVLGEGVMAAFGFLASMAKPISDVFVALIGGIFQTLKGVNWASIGSVLLDVGKILFSLLGKGMILAAKGFQWLTEAFRNIDWDAVMPYVGEAAKKVFLVIIGVGWEILKGIPNIVIGVMNAAWSAMKALWNSAMTAIGNIFGPFAGVVKAIFAAITVAASAMFAILVAGFVTAQIQGLLSFLKIAAGASTAWASILGPIVLVVAGIYGIKKAVEFLTEKFGLLGAAFGMAATVGIVKWGGVIPRLTSIADKTADKVKEIAAQHARSAAKIAENATETAEKVTKTASNGITKASSAATDGVSKMASKSGVSLSAMLGPVGAVSLAIAGIGMAAKAIYDNWDELKGWWKDLMGDVEDTTKSSMKSIESSAVENANRVKKKVDEIDSAIRKIRELDVAASREGLQKTMADYDKLQAKLSKARSDADAAAKKMEEAKSNPYSFEYIQAQSAYQKATDDVQNYTAAAYAASNKLKEETGLDMQEMKKTVGKIYEQTNIEANASWQKLGDDQRQYLKNQTMDLQRSSVDKILDIQRQLATGTISPIQAADKINAVYANVGKRMKEIDGEALAMSQDMGSWLSGMGKGADLAGAALSRINSEFEAAIATSRGDRESVYADQEKEYIDLQKKLMAFEIKEFMKTTELTGNELAEELGKIRERYASETRTFLGEASNLTGTEAYNFFSNAIKPLQGKVEEWLGIQAKMGEKGIVVDNKIAEKKQEEQDKNYTKAERRAIDHANAVSEALSRLSPGQSDLFQSLSGISVSGFQKKTEGIKTAYLKFLGAITSEGEVLFGRATGLFQGYEKDFGTVWGKLATAFVNNFITPTTNSLNSFWNAFILQIQDNSRQAIAELQNMYVQMGLADAPAQSSAGGSSGEVSTASVASPDMSVARKNLVDSINRPDWYREYIAYSKRRDEQFLERMERLIYVSGKGDPAVVKKIVDASQKEAVENLGNSRTAFTD